MNPNNIRSAIIAGFAMFAMFFGSGNLVFPILIGQANAGTVLAAFLGLFITGIIIPFLGVYSMIIMRGERDAYFERIGKVPARLIVTLMLSLLGPFAVVPRCIIVAHSGAEMLLPDLSLALFSAVFCVLAAAVIWRHHHVVNILGKYLMPILMLGLVAIVISGFYNANVEAPTMGVAVPAFLDGAKTGYQTMDLIAGFFFGITTIEHLYRRCGNDAKTLRIASIIACLVGISLLTIVYFSFVYLGAKYADILGGVHPEKLLVKVAHQSLGNTLATPIISLTVMMACFTTAVILAMLFAEFVTDQVGERKYLNRHTFVILTLALAFVMTFLGFASIAKYLATILAVLYPALIVLAVMTMTNIRVFKKRRVLVPIFYCMAILGLMTHLL
jgi:LIVCS family branched-chain amino acid:cation transporter